MTESLMPPNVYCQKGAEKQGEKKHINIVSTQITQKQQPLQVNTAFN